MTDNHPSFIAVTEGMRGFFCVMMAWTWTDKEKRLGFYEPWTSSEVSFSTYPEAQVHGEAWAKAEGLEFRP